MPQTQAPVDNNLVARMLPNGMLEVRDRRTNEIVQGARLANTDEQAAIGNSAVVLGDESQEVIRDTPDEVIYREGPLRTVYRYDKKAQTREVWDLQELVPDDVKRPIAGYVSPFIDTPGEGYLPAGAEQAQAGIYQLYNLLADNTMLPRAQNDYLDRATTRVQGADQSLRDAIGLSLPSTPLDYALEIGGAMLMPSPQISRLTAGIQVGLDAIPGMAGRQGGLIRNAVDAAGSGIGGRNIFGREGGLIHDTAAVIGETLTPLRQTNLPVALGTQVPLGIGVAETIDTGNNTENYTSIVDAIDKATTYQPTAYDGIPQEAIDMFEAETDVEIQAMMATIIEEEIAAGNIVAPEPEVPAWRNPAVTSLAGLGLFAGGAVGLRMATANARAARMAPTPVAASPATTTGTTPTGGATQTTIATGPLASVSNGATPNLAGRRRLMEGSSLSSRIVGGIAQGDQVLRDMIRASGGSEDAVNRLTRNTPQASDIIIGRTLNTGIFPNGRRMQSPAATVEALSKELDEADWDTLSNGLLARSALDDFNRTKVHAAFTQDANGNPMSIADLQAMVANMQANPRATAYADMITDAHRQPLAYALDEGFISQSAYDNMITDMPNYVPLGRNTGQTQTGSTLFGGSRSSYQEQTQVANLLERSTVEGGGVKVGDAMDPIRGLPEYISNIIRKVEQNTTRVQAMDILLNNPDYSRVIRRVPAGETSQATNAIELRRNGVQEFYIVDDPALYTALTFNNRLTQNTFSDILSAPARITQSFLTGPLAPFFQGVVSPAYDMTLGAVMRPRGFDLGLLSEAANKLIPSLDTLIPGTGTIPTVTRDTLNAVGDRLKALDPTVLISPTTGAARLGWDSFLEGQAISLTEQLIRNDGLVYRMLGQQGTASLRDRLTRAYEASVKSQMEEVGASSSGLMLTRSTGENIDAVANSAPTFFERASRRAMDDAIDGNPATINELIQRGNGFARRVGSATPVRAYMNLMRILGEGFRYQAFATNSARAARSAEAAQEVGNQTRRIAGDVFEHGASDPIAHTLRAGLYGNPAVQGTAQMGRRLKDQPLTTALNAITFGSLAAALQYGLANDPDTAEYIRSLTPEQQASRIVLAPDSYIPVAQELRNLWAPFSLTMNDLTGINEGQYDGAYGKAFWEMLDGEVPLSELASSNIETAFNKQSDQVLGADVGFLFPVNKSSFPIINAAAAAAGFDMGMSAYAESPTEIKSQTVSGLGGDGILANDNIFGIDVSASAMGVIEELLSGASTNFLRIAMDVQRAFDADMETEEAVSIGISRFQDQNARRAGPVRGLLFGDHVFEQSANTANSRMYFDKVDGIEAAEAIYTSDFTNQALTSQQDTATARPNEAERVDLQGTALMPIIIVTHEMTKDLADYRSRISGLNKAIADVRNQTRTSIEERNRLVNEYREDVEELTEQSLFIVEQTEDTLRGLLNDPSFSYQNFDPERYRNIPYSPATPQ